ncbi:hypothetical protein PVAP13_1KG051085 [Panicum virgatum]|uniref:Uncharacterized protein n=1 Tax=Panicum virgatum TaxID=38727 RepID=A0A8T0XKR7_PANVG|nr:hypothetical protein PVAP13_1KG051085 [Panicum virgatum]
MDSCRLQIDLLLFSSCIASARQSGSSSSRAARSSPPAPVQREDAACIAAEAAATIREQHADAGTCTPPGTSSTSPSQSPRARVTKHTSPRTAHACRRRPASLRRGVLQVLNVAVPCRRPLEVHAATADAPRRPAVERAPTSTHAHSSQPSVERRATPRARDGVHPWQLMTTPSP